MGALHDDLWWSLAVPVGLVADRDLSLEARYLYMVLASRCGPGEDSCQTSLRRLAEVSGVRANGTLRSYLRELGEKGWVSIARRSGPRPSVYTLRAPNGPTTAEYMVRVPAGLVHNRYLSPAAKCLYAAFAVYCQRVDAGFTARQSELAKVVGLANLGTLRGLIRQLSHAGWLRMSRGAVPRVYQYEPLDPHLETRKSALDRLEVRLDRELYKGEALMKEMLSVLISDDRFQDNARPGFLTNPLTDERLEFDRWYTEANVAFEFNGPQHFKPTVMYSDPDKVRRQRARDLMKAEIARQHGVHLVLVQPTDLNFEWFKARVTGLFPVRQLRLDDPVVRYLDSSSRAYVRRVGWEAKA